MSSVPPPPPPPSPPSPPPPPSAPVALAIPAGADDWHARLLASLRDCGVQRPAHDWVLQSIITFVVVLVLGLVSKFGSRALEENLQTEGDRAVGIGIEIVWTLFCVFVLARVINRLLRRSWQKRARTAEEELMRSGSRRPVLYLRSFALDERIGRPYWTERWLGLYPMQTAEQAVTKRLRKVGPTIAIGRPDEQLPGLGAARFYVSHDRWQAKVAEITKESQLVLFATGVTEGLKWEISHLVESVPPEKLILWAHPHLLKLSQQDREAEWTNFRAMLGGVFPKPLPETLGEARFIYFHSDWTPVPVAPWRRPWPYESANRSALNAVLQTKQGKVAESKIIYTGPREGDNFAALIGAEGRPVRWLRAAGFVVSYFLASLALLIVLNNSFPPFDEDSFHTWIRPLLDAVLFPLVALAAFRCIQNRWIAAVAASVVYALLSSTEVVAERGGTMAIFWLAWSGQWSAPVQVTFLFLAGLIVSTRRMAPLFWALLFGGLWYPVIFWLHIVALENQEVPDDQAFQYLCIRPAVFAVCFAIVVWLTKKRAAVGFADGTRSVPAT